MTCFENLIGLRGLYGGNDVSFYLDQCGITSDLLGNINYTHDELEALLLDLMDEASRFVATQVKTLSYDKFSNIGTLQADRIGHPARNLTSVAAKTGYDAGAVLELYRDVDYVKISIDSISLFVNTTGNVNVLIYDLTEGRLLDTITVAAVSGQMVYKDVNKTYTAQKRNLALGFLYDSSFTSNKTTALPNQTCSGCSKKSITQGRYVTVAGAKFADGDAKTLENVTYESDTAGVSVTYTVQCDYEQWICKNREVLLLPVLYYTAQHIGEYGLRSSRINEDTTDLRDILGKIRDMAESKYNAEISGAINAMVPPKHSDCFKCKQTSRHRTTL